MTTQTPETPRALSDVQRRHVLRRALDTQGLITLTEDGREFTFVLIPAGGELTVDGAWVHPLDPDDAPRDGDKVFLSDARMVYQRIPVPGARGCGFTYYGSDFSEEQIITWGMKCLTDDELIAMGAETALRSMAQEQSLRRGFYLEGLRAAKERGEERPWEAATEYEKAQARAHGLGSA